MERITTPRKHTPDAPAEAGLLRCWRSLPVALFSTILVVSLAAQEKANQPPGEGDPDLRRVATEAEGLPAVVPTPQETYWGKVLIDYDPFTVTGTRKRISSDAPPMSSS